MALSIKSGTYRFVSGTGNKSVTGVGFQPKVLLFNGTAQSADNGYGVNFLYSVGFTTGSGQQASIGWGSQNLSASSARNKSGSSTAHFCYQVFPGYTPYESEAYTSFDADGWTMSQATGSGVNNYNGYLALGGTDVSNAKVVTFNCNSGTGNQSITGLGFQPDWLMFITAGLTSDTTTANDIKVSIGMANATSQYSTAHTDIDAANPTTVAQKQISGKVFSTINASGAELLGGSLVSMDSDGFTVNITTAISGARVHVLAIKGPAFSVGAETTKTSTGTKSTTTQYTSPSGIIQMNQSRPANSSADTTVARFNFGHTSGTSHTRATWWVGATDNVSTAAPQQGINMTKFIRMADVTSTTLDQADLSSLDAGGFTLNYDTADSTAREFIYTAIHSADKYPTTRTTTFTADAVILPTSGITHTADAMVIAAVTTAITADGIIQDYVWYDADGNPHYITTFTSDAIIINASQITADAIILATNTATTTSDGIVLATTTATVTADGIISGASTLDITADGIVLAEMTATVTADGIILATNISTITADGVILSTNTAAITADGVILEEKTATITADAVIVSGTIDLQFTVDAIVTTASTGIKIKIDSNFVSKPARVKVNGTFSTVIVKHKSGGIFL